MRDGESFCPWNSSGAGHITPEGRKEEGSERESRQCLTWGLPGAINVFLLEEKDMDSFRGK
jgi:hypothetical protein